MLKIGILGAGQAAASHAAGITKSGLAQVTKIYAPGDGEELAPRFGARPARDAEEIFGDGAIDAVIIASPTDTHLEYLKRAAGSGKHLLCETPLVRTAEEADELEALLPRFDGRVAAAALTARFDAPILSLKQALEGEELGRLGLLRIGNLRAFRAGADDWYGDFARSGGAALDLLPHLLDAVRFCCGDLTRLHALRGAGPTDLSHDYVLLTARLASGAIVHVEASWTEAEGADHVYYEAACSEGILEFDTRIEPKLALQPKSAGQTFGDSALAPTDCNPTPATCHQLLAADFAKAILNGKAPAASLADALSATRLALTALASADAGTVVAAGR